MKDFSRLFSPRHIALFGGGWAENVAEQLQKINYQGEIWPVHPERRNLASIPCVKTIADLPCAPDAAFVGVNHSATLEVIGELSSRGAGGAICFASGWKEIGADDRQQALIKAAGDMPLFGPNCYGLINYLDRVALWPDQHGGLPVERGVAILSQSSNIAINLTMQRRGLPIAAVVCLGNAAQTGAPEIGMALLEDKRITSIGLYLEDISDVLKFADLASRAREFGKRLIVLRSGKSQAGQEATKTHTAALSSDSLIVSAFLQQLGVIEVDGLSVFLETLKIAHYLQCFADKSVTIQRFCSLSCSGGEAALVADLAEKHPLSFPPPEPALCERLTAILGDRVPLANPLDYHTYIWGDGIRMSQLFTEMLRAYDAGIFVLDIPRTDRCDPSSYQCAIEAIGHAVQQTQKPAFVCASLPEGLDESMIADLVKRGAMPLLGLETSLAALSRVFHHPQPQTGESSWRPFGPEKQESPTSVEMVDEATAKDWLKTAGLPVPAGVEATNLQELVTQAPLIQPPFALKGLGFAHKAAAGALRLNLENLDDHPPMDGASGYLLEEMVTDGLVELLVGLRRDPVFGIALTLAAGGRLTELMDDHVTLLLPLSRDDIAHALMQLRISALWTGSGPPPRPEMDYFIDLVEKLSNFMQSNPDIDSLELNPVIVREKDAVIVDALIFARKPSPSSKG